MGLESGCKGDAEVRAGSETPGRKRREMRSRAGLAVGGRGVWMVFVVALSALALVPAAASAAAPPTLWKKGENCGNNGKTNAGECSKAGELPSGEKFVETVIPRGIASDPETGHLYLS